MSVTEPKDVIRMPMVAIGMLEAPVHPLKRLFGLGAKPNPASDIDELDEVFVWYVRDGGDLYDSLYRLGLGPPAREVFPGEPTATYADDAEGATAASRAFPPPFAERLGAWLAVRRGRRLWLRICDDVITVGDIQEAERALISKATVRRQYESGISLRDGGLVEPDDKQAAVLARLLHLGPDVEVG